MPRDDKQRSGNPSGPVGHGAVGRQPWVSIRPKDGGPACRRRGKWISTFVSDSCVTGAQANRSDSPALHNVVAKRQRRVVVR